MSRFRLTLSAAVVTVVGFAAPAVAGPQSALARETAEFIARRFGREAVPMGVEALARRAESLAARYGDEVFAAARKVGPQAFRAVEEAGEHAGVAAKLLAHHGEEALAVVTRREQLALVARYGEGSARVLIRHGAAVEPLLEAVGRPAAVALEAVSSRNARRLAMMLEARELQTIGRTPEVLAVVGRFGDRAMEFVWRHKGALTVSAVLARFLTDPQPFLDGAARLTETVADSVVRPVARVPGQVAVEAARRTDWTVVGGVAVLTAGVLIGLRMWVRSRARKPAL
jgi:hypothetical protein